MQHPDEGTIHAWLDGALPAEESRAFEEHVAECAECAARVAEARGLVAGASRILGALDDVPAGVVPVARRPPRSAPRTAWRRRPGVGIAAAMTIVAIGTTMVLTRDWQRTVPSAAESTAPMVLGAGDSAVGFDASAPLPTAVPEAQVSADAAEAASDSRRASEQVVPARPPGGTLADRQARETRAAQRTMQEPVVTGLESIRPPGLARVDRDETVASSKARARVAAGAAAVAPPATPMRDSVAALEAPRLADALPREEKEAARQRLMRETPAPVAGSRALSTLMVTETSITGCYALELRQAAAGTGPELPSVVQLAVSAPQPADAAGAPSARGFNRGEQPLLVPPAADSAQVGWRLTDDSVAVRVESDGRAVLLTFPPVLSKPRVGLATAPGSPGVPSWSAPMLVERVPCPSR